MHRPFKLLTNGSDSDNVIACRKLRASYGPQGKGKTEKQNSLYNNNPDLDVSRSMSSDTNIAGLGISFLPKPPKAKHKKGRPTDQQNRD